MRLQINNWLQEQTRRYRWRNFFCILAVIVCNIPLLVGLLTTPKGGQYLWRTTLAPADTMVYFGAIQEAAQGHILTSNPFTQEPQRARLFEPLWLIQGWISRGTHIPPTILYHIVRTMFVVWFCLFLWRVTERFVVTEKERLFAFFLLVFGSGFGWFDYLVLRKGASYDLWVSEFNPLLTMMHSSLFMLSQALILILLFSWWKMLENGRGSWWWGFVAAILGILHPYDIVTVGAACFGMMVLKIATKQLRIEHVRQAALAVAWMVPVGIYYYWVLQEPVLLGWARQNVDRIGPIWRIVLGLGIWLPLSIYGAYSAYKQRIRWIVPMVAWILVVMIIISIPGITFARRLVNGIQIPFILLSLVGLLPYVRRWLLHRRTYMVLGICTISVCTIFVILIHQSLSFIDPARSSYPSYFSADEVKGIEAVNRYVPSTTAVWSNPWIGNALAGLYVRPVVLGHGHQTMRASTKFSWWDKLRTVTTTDAERMEIIQQTSPWLVWNKGDQVGEYQPGSDPHWQEVWSNGSSALYYYQ